MKMLYFFCLAGICFLTNTNLYAMTHPVDTLVKTYVSPQGKWSYATSHQGTKAIVFIHGAGSSQKIWKNQYALSYEGYKNIFIDLLGYGLSEKPDSGYLIVNWVAGIHAILQKEQIDEAVIVAHSNGVIIAKAFYRQYPESIESMILLDGMLKPMIQKPMLEWMKSALERPDYEDFMKMNASRMPVAGLSEEDAALLKEDALATPKRVTRGELDMVMSDETWQAIAIDCPTILIYTPNMMWSEDYFDWVKKVIPNNQLSQWEDSGHFIPLQHPERLKDLISQAIQIE